MDRLLSTQGFTTPMRGVKLMRLAGCCSRALVQAARTRSFAILCKLVKNASCDRCVRTWIAGTVLGRLLSSAMWSPASPDSENQSSRRRSSPSTAEGSVGWTTVQRRVRSEARRPEAGLHSFGLARAPTPSLRQEQQFCTAEAIAAIVSIDDRSRAS